MTYNEYITLTPDHYRVSTKGCLLDCFKLVSCFNNRNLPPSVITNVVNTCVLFARVYLDLKLPQYIDLLTLFNNVYLRSHYISLI